MPGKYVMNKHEKASILFHCHNTVLHSLAGRIQKLFLCSNLTLGKSECQTEVNRGFWQEPFSGTRSQPTLTVTNTLLSAGRRRLKEVVGCRRALMRGDIKLTSPTEQRSLQNQRRRDNAKSFSSQYSTLFPSDARKRLQRGERTRKGIGRDSASATVSPGLEASRNSH